MAKKKWFLDYFCGVVAKSVVRECCAEMELSTQETKLVLERFCDKKGMLACEDFSSIWQQKNYMPVLDAKVRGWVERNIDKFKPSELVHIYKFLLPEDETPDL